MLIPRISRAKRGGQISADELNRAFEAIERLTNITATAPLNAQRGPTGYTIAYDEPPRFPVRLTQSGGNGAYAWKEQLFSGNGIYIDRPGGRTGSIGPFGIPPYHQPAWEDNLNPNVYADPVNGTVVEIHAGWFNANYGQEWQFSYCCGVFTSSSSSSYSSSSSSISSSSVSSSSSSISRSSVSSSSSSISSSSVSSSSSRVSSSSSLSSISLSSSSSSSHCVEDIACVYMNTYYIGNPSPSCITLATGPCVCTSGSDACGQASFNSATSLCVPPTVCGGAGAGRTAEVKTTVAAMVTGEDIILGGSGTLTNGSCDASGCDSQFILNQPLAIWCGEISIGTCGTAMVTCWVIEQGGQLWAYVNISFTGTCVPQGQVLPLPFAGGSVTFTNVNAAGSVPIACPTQYNITLVF